MSRRLLAYTDATLVAGAEQSLGVLLANLPAEVEIVVAGPERRVLEAIVAERPDATMALLPPLRDSSDLHRTASVRRAIARIRPDAIHLNKTEVANLRYVEIAVRSLPAIRTVSVVHHVERPVTTMGRALTARLAQGADGVVAVSRVLADELAGLLRLPAERVVAIPNALPLIPVAPRERSDRITVGTLARFVPHKAVGDLISAVAATDAVHLRIGGDGPERYRLERLAWRLGIAGRVDFLGWVDPDEVLDDCDIVASAARIEGHPMTLLDARRRGLPIVATDVGGVPEIVEDGVTGLLVPPGHVTGLAAAIARLARDDRLRVAMGRAGLAAAAVDNPTAMAAAYHRLYWPNHLAPRVSPAPLPLHREAQRVDEVGGVGGGGQ